jgi:hypothetical protein
MPNGRYSDVDTSKLRTIVHSIQEELARTPPTEAMGTVWRELVAVLELGPEPLTRECPACHSVGMRDAKRCGRCWIALEPLKGDA